jgi:uncharacterized protein (TIGR00369 family)
MPDDVIGNTMPSCHPVWSKPQIRLEDDDRHSPFWEMMDGLRPLAPASRLLGWRLLILDCGKGRIHVEFTAGADFINPIGTVQGGIIAAMLDDAMGYVATAFLGGHHMVPTLELKTSFMRAAKVGPLFVEARVVHAGREIAFLEGSMKDEVGRLIATATATARIYRWPPTEMDGRREGRP